MQLATISPVRTLAAAKKLDFARQHAAVDIHSTFTRHPRRGQFTVHSLSPGSIAAVARHCMYFWASHRRRRRRRGQCGLTMCLSHASHPVAHARYTQARYLHPINSANASWPWLGCHGHDDDRHGRWLCDRVCTPSSRHCDIRHRGTLVSLLTSSKIDHPSQRAIRACKHTQAVTPTLRLRDCGRFA